MKLALGSAQFGLKYGIDNIDGKVSANTAFQILDAALQFGVRSIDTAHEYGDSEEVLGSHPNLGAFDVISKSSHRCRDSSRASFFRDFSTSLEKLSLQKLDGFLMHQQDDLLVNPSIYTFLQDLKELGKIRKIGVSFYDTEFFFETIKSFDLDLIQVPLSIFDQEFVQSGALETAKEKGIEVHVRSAYMQGLPFVAKESRNTFFDPICGVLDSLSSDAESHGESLQSILFHYVNDLAVVDKVVMGFQNLGQLKEVVELEKVPISFFNHFEPRKYEVPNKLFSKPKNWKLI